MFLILSIILLLGAVIISGDLLLRGALSVSKKFNISPFILGVTVVAIGTSLPDLFIASISSLNGFYDISISALVGSGIVNILLGIGIASIIGGISYDKQDCILRFGMFYNALFTILFIISIYLTKGKIGLIFSSILLASAVIFLIINVRFLIQNDEEEPDLTPEIQTKKQLIKAIFFLIGGLIGLVTFSDLLLKFVVQASELYLVPKKVIASIIIGIGNSLPEIITCIMAALKNRSRIIIGNIVGSNIFILGGVLGLTGIISNLKVAKEIEVILPILALDIPVLLFSTLLFFICFKIKSRFGAITGLIFIFIYLIYLLLQLNII